jgi:NAD(P)-dependent dehydrogenase (short-subunit alcohol dehydrogenase family)
MQLAGKVAFVTGGSRGIGAAIVAAMAKAGAAVAFSYRDRADAANKVTADVRVHGGKPLAIKMEVTDRPAVRSVRLGGEGVRAAGCPGEQRRYQQSDGFRSGHRR